MIPITAHFNGRVLVPDEPLNLPVNQPLRVIIELEDGTQQKLTLLDLAGVSTGNKELARESR